MILPTMTPDEIIAEMKRDEPFINNDAREWWKSIRKRKPLVGNGAFPKTTIRTVKTNRNNEYISAVIFQNEKEYRGRSIPKNSLAAIVYTKQGYALYNRYAIKDHIDHIGHKTDGLSVHIPHFFHRYRERMELDESLSAKDVIKHFFQHNALSKTSHAEYDGKTLIFNGCQNGAEFGTLEGNFNRIATFVPYDMLFKDQSNLHDEMLKSIYADLKALSGGYAVPLLTDEEEARQNHLIKALWRSYAKHSLGIDAEVAETECPYRYKITNKTNIINP